MWTEGCGRVGVLSVSTLMSAHSLCPEVEMCSLWGTVCTANVRGRSQGEECLVLSAVKCACARVCVYVVLTWRCSNDFFFPSCVVFRFTRRLFCLLPLTRLLWLGISNGWPSVALSLVWNREFASAVLLLLLVENFRTTRALGDLQWYEVYRVSWKSA